METMTPPTHPPTNAHAPRNQSANQALSSTQPWKSNDILIPQSSQAVQKQIQNTQKKG